MKKKEERKKERDAEEWNRWIEEDKDIELRERELEKQEEKRKE